MTILRTEDNHHVGVYINFELALEGDTAMWVEIPQLLLERTLAGLEDIVILDRLYHKIWKGKFPREIELDKITEVASRSLYLGGDQK